MPVVYKEVEVDVDLSDFDDNELIEELANRGHNFDIHGPNPPELVTKIYENRRLGKDYQQELDELIYATLGKII